MSTSKPKVLILGAGLSGLTLAQCLRKREIPFKIFERESTFESRTQGWAIALHSILDDLLDSIPVDLPPIDETSHLRPLVDVPAQLAYYADGKKFSVTSSAEHRVVRANRLRLREWLATGIDIEMGRNVVRIEEYVEDGGGVELFFEDGASAAGDVLVGADGANSFGDFPSFIAPLPFPFPFPPLHSPSLYANCQQAL